MFKSSGLVVCICCLLLTLSIYLLVCDNFNLRFQVLQYSNKALREALNENKDIDNNSPHKINSGMNDLAKVNKIDSSMNDFTTVNKIDLSMKDIATKALLTNQLKTGKIIFNRVPKCGSLAIRKSFEKLKDINHFNVNHSPYGGHFNIPDKNLYSLAKLIDSFPEPCLFIRHINFINFTRFSLEMPYYVNVIRNPYDRLVSFYYYKNYLPDENVTHINIQKKNSAFTFTKLTLDQCVEQKDDKACALDDVAFVLIPWFCGHTNTCLTSPREALQLAKTNVEKYCPVVGYVENIQEFFEVAEKVWPHYFTGLPEIGRQMMTDRAHKTKARIEPNNQTKEILMDALGLEFEFYSFIKQRFHYIKNLLNEK